MPTRKQKLASRVTVPGSGAKQKKVLEDLHGSAPASQVAASAAQAAVDVETSMPWSLPPEEHAATFCWAKHRRQPSGQLFLQMAAATRDRIPHLQEPVRPTPLMTPSMMMIQDWKCPEKMTNQEMDRLIAMLIESGAEDRESSFLAINTATSDIHPEFRARAVDAYLRDLAGLGYSDAVLSGPLRLLVEKAFADHARHLYTISKMAARRALIALGFDPGDHHISHWILEFEHGMTKEEFLNLCMYLYTIQLVTS